MADDLRRLVCNVLYNSDSDTYDLSPLFSMGPQDLEKQWHIHMDRLLNHLKTMMVGYENEEVQGLIKDIEGMAENTWCEFDNDVLIRDKMFKIIGELCNIRDGASVEGEETVVGFDDDVETLLDQLTQTSVKQLQVITIAGMAGLGKTTLATRLYRDPLIEYYFDIRAWACVSQSYIKRDLLIGILSSFIYDLTKEIHNMSDEQLGEKLYRP